MFIPGPLLTEEGNRIVVWELDVARSAVADFVPEPRLGHTEA